MKISERRLDLYWREVDLIQNCRDVNYSPIANPVMDTDDNASRVAVKELDILVSGLRPERVLYSCTVKKFSSFEEHEG